MRFVVYGAGAVGGVIGVRLFQHGHDVTRIARGTHYEAIRGRGRDRAGGSTFQSLTRRTGTIEADYLNGEIVLIGREHGVPTPVNELLRALANRMARERLSPGLMTREEFLKALSHG